MNRLTVPFLSGGKEFTLSVIDMGVNGLSDTFVVVCDASEDVIDRGFIFFVDTDRLQCDAGFTRKLEFVLRRTNDTIVDLRRPKVRGATR